MMRQYVNHKAGWSLAQRLVPPKDCGKLNMYGIDASVQGCSLARQTPSNRAKSSPAQDLLHTPIYSKLVEALGQHTYLGSYFLGQHA